MRIQIHRRDRFHFMRPTTIGGRSLMVAAGLLAALQVANAQTAPVFKQTVQRFTTLGQSTIQGGPAGSAAVATLEIRPETDLGVKAETTGGASAVARPNSRLVNQHGLPIPSKEAARLGFVPAGNSGLSESSAASHLPPPPTLIPNPKGSAVVDSSNRVFGFPGLTHLDQRTAGTGKYTNTQFSLEPPDQALCAGGGFVVEAVNNAIAVYDTDGNALTGPEALSQFWGLTPEVDRVTGIVGQFISDPKCAYDRETQRWFITELMQDTGTVGTGRNFNLIAVSKTSDPRGGFLIVSYDVTDDGLNGTPNHPGCPCFGDQPLLGFDEFGVYQSTNEFGAKFNGAQVYAIPKRGLIDAASHGDFSHLYVVALDASQALVPFGGLSYSIQPAVGSADMDEHDSSGRGVEFFLSALQFGVPPYQLLDNRIAVWALGNTRSLETLSPELTLAFDVIASETYGQPNQAQQKPGPIPQGDSIKESLEFINTNDDRMNQVVYSGGLLYSGVNTLIGDGSRTGIAWFGVDPKFSHGNVSGRVVRQGYVAVDGESVIFPSLAFADGDKGLVGFTLVGPDFFPSAAYMNIGEGDGDNSAVHISANGAAPDDGFSGYVAFSGGNVGRWGDYSAAVSDGDNVWFATEYIPSSPRTVLANWGTFVTKVRPQH